MMKRFFMILDDKIEKKIQKNNDKKKINSKWAYFSSMCFQQFNEALHLLFTDNTSNIGIIHRIRIHLSTPLLTALLYLH